MTGVICCVDMDGPLAQFDAAFYAHCEEMGYPMHSTLETQCHRFATDCIIDPDARRAARHHVDTSDWFRHLPVVEGAIEGINALLEHPEVEDVFIVTKPMKANKMVHSSKAAWVLEHLGSDWTDRLIITPDKGMVRGSVLLDDAPKSAWFTRAEWMPVIYPTPWNTPGSEWSRKEGCSHDPRWSWSDPIDDLIELAQINKMVMR